MKKNNKGIWNVFLIQNKNTLRVFIGATKDNPKDTLRKHFFMLKNKKSYSPSLQRDFDKFGPDAFDWKIIAEKVSKAESRRIKKQFFLTYENYNGVIPESFWPEETKHSYL